MDVTLPLVESTASELAEQLADQLSALLATRWAERSVPVTTPVRLSGGASRETWSFTAERDGVPVPLILRRDPPSEPRGEGMAREAVALAAARRAGVPEPELVAWSADRDQLDAAYLVMTFVEGETIARRIPRDQRYAPARARFARQCGEILAGIHGLDLAEVPGLVDRDGDVVELLRRSVAAKLAVANPRWAG